MTGISCLELFETILAMPHDCSSSINKLRGKVIEIFTQTEASDVLVKAASVPVEDLESRLTTEVFNVIN